MNRRSFLKGVMGATAALILPPEPEKRFFQLDRTMMGWQDGSWPGMEKRMVPGFVYDEYADHEALMELWKSMETPVNPARMMPWIPGDLYWSPDDYSIWKFERGNGWSFVGAPTESPVSR